MRYFSGGIFCDSKPFFAQQQCVSTTNSNMRWHFWREYEPCLIRFALQWRWETSDFSTLKVYADRLNYTVWKPPACLLTGVNSGSLNISRRLSDGITRLVLGHLHHMHPHLESNWHFQQIGGLISHFSRWDSTRSSKYAHPHEADRFLIWWRCRRVDVKVWLEATNTSPEITVQPSSICRCKQMWMNYGRALEKKLNW